MNRLSGTPIEKALHIVDADNEPIDKPGQPQVKDKPPAAGARELALQGHSAPLQSHSAPQYLPENNAEKEESNRRDEHGHTPLMAQAASKGSHEQIRLLLKQGADPAQQDEQGNTALFYAVDSGNEDAVRILAEHDRTLLSHRNKAGETAAAVAARKGDASVLMRLIYSGADLYGLDNGKSLLMHAAKSGNEQTLERLVKEFRLRNESFIFPQEAKFPDWERMLFEAAKFSIEEKCDSEASRVLVNEGLRYTSLSNKQELMKLAEEHDALEVVGLLLQQSPVLRFMPTLKAAHDKKQQ